MRHSFALMLLFAAAAISPAAAATLCGPLDGPGCVPTVCSVLDPRPCLGDEDLPFSGDLRLTIDSRSASGIAKPDHDLNTLRDLSAMLRACWAPPAREAAAQDMQMSVRISFNRAGQLILPPRLTYALPGSSAKVRARYREAISTSLAACTPLHVTKGLGAAIAGRPIMIRFVDDRDLD